MDSLFKLFANPTLVDVLSLFLLNPEEEFYQSDIAKKTNKALMQVQRTLKTLNEIGLISIMKRGKMIYYKVVRTHPAFEDLKKIFLKTVSLGDGIRQALLPLQDKIHFAFIYGSVARGDESIDSDIDLFIITDATLRELSKVLSPFAKDLNRELNPVVFDPLEFLKRISEKERFLLEVIKAPKIWIIGHEPEFNKMVKRRKT